MNGSDGPPRFPRNLLIDCFPLSRFGSAGRPALSPASGVEGALELIRTGDGQKLGTLWRRGTAVAGLASDELRLLYAAWLSESGEPQQARDAVLDLLPYATADRKRLVLAHLIRAQAAGRSGSLREAWEGCVAAHQLVDTSKMGELRVPVLCLWAQVSAGDQTAVAYARRAVALARTPPWTFHAHATLAALLVEPFPYQAVEQVRLARPGAPPDADATLTALEAAAFDRLSSPPTRDRADVPVDARVLLSDHPHLMVGLRTYPMAGSPILAVLVAYLVENPGARLVEISEHLLPEGGGHPTRVRHDDETHRVARVRQMVQRLRRLLGDPTVVVSRNGRLHLGPGYRWTSDLAAIRGDPSVLAPSVSGVWPWPDDMFD